MTQQKGEGFFIVNNKKYSEDSDFLTNALIASEANVEFWKPETKTLAYIPGMNHIIIDTDSEFANQFVETVNQQNNIKPFKYQSASKKPGRFHYIYKVNSYTREFIDIMKLNSQAGKLIVKDIDTRACRFDVNTDRYVSGQDHLVKKGLRSISPLQLEEGLNSDLPDIPLILLHSHKWDEIPKGTESGGEGGWEIPTLKLATNMKSLGFSKEAFIELMKSWTIFNQDILDLSSIDEKWEDSSINKVDNDMKLIFETYNFKWYNKKVWLKNPKVNEWQALEDLYPSIQDISGVMNMRFKRLTQPKTKAEVIKWPMVKPSIMDNPLTQDPEPSITFLNGYVDKFGWHETKNIPFTTTQINKVYNPDIPVDNTVEEFINGFTGRDPEVREKLLMALSLTLANHNSGAFTYIQGPKYSGKTQLAEMLTDIVGTMRTANVDSEAVFGQRLDQFGWSNIESKSFLFFEEFIKNVSVQSTNDIKRRVVPGGHVFIRPMRGEPKAILNTQTWLAVSNHLPNIYDKNDEALQSRMAFFKAHVNDNLSNEQWEYLRQNKGNAYLTKLLVDAYIKVRQFPSFMRAEIFQSKDHDQMWQEILDSDEVLLWIKENDEVISGKDLSVIHTYFQIAISGSKLTRTGLGRLLTKNGYIRNDKGLYEKEGNNE